jgi:hypothetical protein
LPARAVDVASGAVSALDLALPGGATLHHAYCGAHRADSTGAIAGVVRDAESEFPHGGAVVSAAWREVRIDVGAIHTVTRRVPVRVAAGGIFVLCGLPSDVELTLRAEAPGWTSGDVAVHAPMGALVRMDVALGESQTVGARVAGAVRDARGRPLAGATVLVLGTDAHATTGSGGAFRLDGLPDGSWTLEARAIGYEPARLPVLLAQRADAAATLVLDHRVTALDRVVVHGRAASLATIGFLARRRTSAGGAFLGPSELAERQARMVTDMLRGVRGLQVHPSTSGFGAVVRGRGDCRPDVFVDGTLAEGGADVIDDLVVPNDLLAVEIYGGPGETPLEFVPPLGGECGAVVLWTKR